MDVLKFRINLFNPRLSFLSSEGILLFCVFLFLPPCQVSNCLKEKHLQLFERANGLRRIHAKTACHAVRNRDCLHIVKFFLPYLKGVARDNFVAVLF